MPLHHVPLSRHFLMRTVMRIEARVPAIAGTHDVKGASSSSKKLEFLQRESNLQHRAKSLSCSGLFVRCSAWLCLVFNRFILFRLALRCFLFCVSLCFASSCSLLLCVPNDAL